jgi:cytochrome c oxidase subunit 2
MSPFGVSLRHVLVRTGSTPEDALKITLALLLLAAAAAAQDVHYVEVTASRFKFEPAVITVDQGDHVRLTARSADGVHGFAIKAFKVKAALPKGGAPVTVEFVADQAGSFDITCSEYCGSGHNSMKATLVVRPGAQ